MTTPNLNAPEISEAQLNKFLTHNEALRYFDAIAKNIVIAIQSSQPIMPAEGDAYIVLPVATGDWLGKDNYVAFFFGGIWKFIPPSVSWKLTNKTDQNIYQYDSSLAWVLFQTAQVVPRPNLAIDSGFNLWTNGLTNSFGTYKYVSGGFSAERLGGAVGATASRQAGFSAARYCLRIARNAGNADVSEIRVGQIFTTSQSLFLAGKYVSLSFDARRGANFAALGNAFSSSMNPGATIDEGGNLGNFSVNLPASTAQHQLTTTASRYRHSFLISGSATQLKFVFSWTPVGTAGANDYVEITNIKIEQSALATPFDPSSVANDQAGLNYLFKSTYNNGVSPGAITNTGRRVFYAPVAINPDVFPLAFADVGGMRIAPTCVVYSPTTGTAGFVNIDTIGDRVATFTEASEKTAVLTYNNVPNIAADARIYYHFTMDARL